MVAVPGMMDVAIPSKPVSLLTVATPAGEELQVTSGVRSTTVSSERIPAAVNCWIEPLGILTSGGSTSIAIMVAGITVNRVLPDIFPKVAVIVAVP